MKTRPPRNRAFTIALVISGILHLSAVSVFSIMIWFPRHDMKFFSVEIVRQAVVASAGDSALPAAPSDSPSRQTLRVRSTDELLGDGDTAAATDSMDAAAIPESWAELPPIDLPKIEFAEFDRLRTREESLKIRSQFTELFDAQPKDSWALFSEELRGLGQRLRSGLTGSDAPSPPRPARVSTPAPGFGVYLQWMGPPYDRQLLFSPPVQALWDVDAVDLAQPIALAFTVNSQGKVIEIQVPIDDEKGISSAIGTALLKYRFAPLRDSEKDQRATLLIAPESGSGLAETGLQ